MLVPTRPLTDFPDGFTLLVSSPFSMAHQRCVRTILSLHGLRFARLMNCGGHRDRRKVATFFGFLFPALRFAVSVLAAGLIQPDILVFSTSEFPSKL
jgi:hypothetical protein